MKTYKYSICLLLAILLISCETEKLDILYYGTINGVVLDAETYKPVEGAMITTTPASISLLSDTEGKFTIQKVKEGEVAVTVKKQDYLSNSLTVAVYDKETTQLDFLIYKDDNNVGNISIFDPVPGNGAVDQATAITLKWKVEGKKANTELTYNIYLFESNSTVQNLLGENVALQEVTTSGLKTATTYYWYVVVKYNGNKIANSPTWTFKTRDAL